MEISQPVNSGLMIQAHATWLPRAHSWPHTVLLCACCWLVSVSLASCAWGRVEEKVFQVAATLDIKWMWNRYIGEFQGEVRDTGNTAQPMEGWSGQQPGAVPGPRPGGIGTEAAQKILSRSCSLVEKKHPMETKILGLG